MYWAATEKDFVIYESRLELARLLLADFDTSVLGIVAQPFLLKALVAGQERKHIPDYLLFTDDVPAVVDVKPRHRVTRPQNAFTFAWTRQVIESRGWQYEVCSEPPLAELENVRLLAGYRRDWIFDVELLEELRVAEIHDAPLKYALTVAPTYSRRAVQAALLHLLWKQELQFDLSSPLNRNTMLRRPR
ncbi:hypothetical protein SAMN05421805_103507 [Saccharopolyspora antimicrobica]|uniref:TnsA endonuclease N terminal n=1 Tax=Saccharopolyspora antimicrobica TaxID=455193 RepID=A0A1I4XNX4_9PSEU|nr:hypothetical protein ATL45_2891 [Saccharopolyspora antimicrobica]SFN27000.1 hypothetical protein SAMN05421805_103507 [Saccharopolyspora antimicrobica]